MLQYVFFSCFFSWRRRFFGSPALLRSLECRHVTSVVDALRSPKAWRERAAVTWARELRSGEILFQGWLSLGPNEDA